MLKKPNKNKTKNTQINVGVDNYCWKIILNKISRAAILSIDIFK